MLFEIVLMIIPKSILSFDMFTILLIYHTILLDSHVHRVLKHLKRVHYTHSTLLVQCVH